MAPIRRSPICVAISATSPRRFERERELRLRSVELTQVNEQLRRINRELEDLKDRYGDLYENAPAMYFSVDLEAKVIECNQTMLSTLHRLATRSSASLITTCYRSRSAAGPGSDSKSFSNTGRHRMRADGLNLTARSSTSGSSVRSFRVPRTRRSMHVAWHRMSRPSDRLEAELQEKNQHLARANDELSQRNRELDEFVHVVSHDLQEPLRTLIAFSDFLLKDYGDRLDDAGQEYVRYLVDASRRMRAMILGLLNLSRAGKVIGDFAVVDLEELVAVVKTDLCERFRAKRGELRIVGPLPRLWGDRDRIGQLLVNLIGNGIKYNESPSPWVEIGAVTSADVGLPGGERTMAILAMMPSFMSRTMASGSSPSFTARSSSCFDGCTRRKSTREQESVWRSAARSYRHTVVEFGSRARLATARRFISSYDAGTRRRSGSVSIVVIHSAHYLNRRRPFIPCRKRH